MLLKVAHVQLDPPLTLLHAPATLALVDLALFVHFVGIINGYANTTPHVQQDPTIPLDIVYVVDLVSIMMPLVPHVLQEPTIILLYAHVPHHIDLHQIVFYVQQGPTNRPGVEMIVYPVLLATAMLPLVILVEWDPMPTPLHVLVMLAILALE